MKRKLQSICVVLAALSCIVFTFCTKEEQPESKDKPKTAHITITAQIGEFHSETKADVVKLATVVWEGGEKIYVYEGSNYLGYIEAPSTISADKVAEFSGTIAAPSSENTILTFVYSQLFTGQPTVSDNQITVDMSTQTTNIPFVIYGTAEYTSAGISKPTVPFKFATSAVMVSVTELEPSVAISKATLLGVNTKCVLTLGSPGEVTVGGSTSGIITRTETSKSSNSSGYAFIEMGVPTSSADADRTITVYQNSIHFGKALADKIEESKYVNSISKLQTGLFTVDASGTKVLFSRGNIQYQAGNGTSFAPKWQFAANQYDYIGNAGNDVSDLAVRSTQSSWIDLFGWGTTGYQDTRTSSTGYQTNYQPYSINDTAVNSADPAYYSNKYGYGPDYDIDNVYGLTVVNNSDWGYCMGGATSVWRTLTGGSHGEWAWLLGPAYSTITPGTNCRTSSTVGTTANARYAKIKVRVSNVDISGLLVFPDVFTWNTTTMGSAPTNCNVVNTAWQDVPIYTADNFTAMESAGCAFLPAAGTRIEFYIRHVGDGGYYWSSTTCTEYGAYCLSFYDEFVYPDDFGSRYYGYSVRLVSTAH